MMKASAPPHSRAVMIKPLPSTRIARYVPAKSPWKAEDWMPTWPIKPVIWISTRFAITGRKASATAG